jgi:hypothetical protein
VLLNVSGYIYSEITLGTRFIPRFVPRDSGIIEGRQGRLISATQQQCVRRINENNQTERKALGNSNVLVALSATKGTEDETGAIIVKSLNLDPIGRSILTKRTWLLHSSHRKYVLC